MADKTYTGGTGDRGMMDRMSDRISTGDKTPGQYRRVMGASTLTGDRVTNSAGEDLGKVHEIMVDVQSGRVAYAVLSFGGFLGMGDKLFAIPWNRLTLDEANKQFLLDVDKDTLKRAPGFDKDDWPDMSDPNWGSQIYTHYGSEPYWDDTRSGSRIGTESNVSGRTGTILDPDRNRGGNF